MNLKNGEGTALWGRQRSDGSGRVRLGIIGCGAITESAHLPAALSSSEVEVSALSDIRESRLRYIRRQFGLGPIISNDYRETFDRVDAVILALPNALHASAGVEFLARGIHVLCEKPLAVTSEECAQLVAVARSTSSALAVGSVTRFFPSTELTKHLIDVEFLGELRSFEYEFGTVGGWPTISGYNLARSTCGGGVLIVSGTHFIDRMLYLFDGAQVVSYVDDSRGGIEANCEAWFSVNVRGRPVKGHITLSKTHRLKNRLRITGEKGALEVGEGQAESVTYRPAHDQVRHEITPSGIDGSKAAQNYFKVQLDDFVRAVRGEAPPKVNGEQGSLSVGIIERCYAIAAPLDEPWCDATLERLKASMYRSTG